MIHASKPGMFFTALLLCTGFAASAQDEGGFPTPHNALTLATMESSPANYTGLTFGFAGEIAQIEPGPDARVLVRLRLKDPNPNERDVWIAPLGRGGLDALKVGDSLSVLGTWARVAPGDLPEGGVAGYPQFHLLTLCLNDFTQDKIIFLRAGENKCMQWAQGTPPEQIYFRIRDDEE